MKPNERNCLKWILFALMLPPLVAVIAPFIMIVRIAFMPEGVSSSNKKELVLWSSASKSKSFAQWDIHGGTMKVRTYEQQDNCLEISWAFTAKDGYAIWIHPFNQSVFDFDRIIVELNTTCSAIAVGFKDIYNNEKYKVFSIDHANRWVNKQILLRDIKMDGLHRENITQFYIKITRPSSGVFKIKKIVFKYRPFTVSNFRDVILTASFGRYLVNSALISLIVMLGNIIFSTMAGFAFAWKEFPLRKTLFISMIAMIIIPAQVLMIPTFILIQGLGWLNTYKALIIPFLIYPINIYLMRQYISKIPRAYGEVALVDGASYFTMFFRIIVPICKPAMAIVGINTFVNSWNSFLYPFILTNTAEMRTLPVGLAMYIGLFDVDWAHLMAASSISAIPVLIVFLCFQRQIIAGMLSGSTYNV